MSTDANPFTISEIGEPGSLVAVADFTCPKCDGHSRFFAHHQGEDGSFICTHCRLVIHIRGTRLSDYQEQLDAINASLGDFTAKVTDRVKKASQRLGATVEEPRATGDKATGGKVAGGKVAGGKVAGGHRHGPGCGCSH